MKQEAFVRAREIKDTHATKLQREVQQDLARRLDDLTDPVYLETAKRPVGASSSPEENQLESETVLPPLNQSRLNHRDHRRGVF